MGKKGSKQPSSGSASINLSLREEVSGKKQHNDPKLMLKLDHLKNLASWASTQGCVPPLAAFFGEKLAASAETKGVPPDPSLFTCQRCESILRPGYNCSVRIEKNHSKKRTCKKSNIPSQNNVCYNCHFCGYSNPIRGTPKGHMKVICPPKVKPRLKPNHAKAADQKSREQKNINTKNYGSSQMDVIAVPDANRNENEVKRGDSRIDMIALPDAGKNGNEANVPATPTVQPVISLLDSKMRKRNRSGAKKATESKSVSASVDVEQEPNASSKRKRKGWTSLKEIAESKKDNGRNCGDLTIPFLI